MSKAVRIKLPEKTGITIIDHYYRVKIKLEFNPECKFKELRRFQNHYHWYIYSNDLEKEVVLNKTLGEQNIQEGDRLDIYLVYSRRH
jgi:hypothetical protein